MFFTQDYEWLEVVPRLSGGDLQLGFQTESWFPGTVSASLACRGRLRLPLHLHRLSNPL